MYFVVASTKSGSGRTSLKSAHGLIPALDTTMILLNPVVISHSPVEATGGL